MLKLSKIKGFLPYTGDFCIRASTKDNLSVNQYKMLVYRAIGHPLKPGDEIFWTYNLRRVGPEAFHPIEDWQLVKCCASTDQQNQSAPVYIIGETEAKKRRLASKGPLKTMKCVEDFILCTYCGENLAQSLKKGEKVNIKRHWALKHTLSLCHEMGMQGVKTVEVSSKDFLLHLDAVDHVVRSLHSHHYKVIPASHFLKSIPAQTKQDDEETKQAVFTAFAEEGKAAFQKYQVLFLNGINVPTCYEDLLPKEISNFRSVKWQHREKPPSNNFSINFLKLSEEEMDKQKSDTEVMLKSIVMGWHMVINKE